MSIYKLYQYQLGLFMYQQLRGLIPISGTFSFVTNASVHDHFTRHHAKIHIKPCRTKKRQLTVVFQGPNLWNTLPPTLTECSSLPIFKKKMKTFLLANLFWVLSGSLKYYKLIVNWWWSNTVLSWFFSDWLFLWLFFPYKMYCI